MLRQSMNELLVSPDINMRYLKEFNPETPTPATGQAHAQASSNQAQASKQRDFADIIQAHQQESDPQVNNGKPDKSTLNEAQQSLKLLKNQIQQIKTSQEGKQPNPVHKEMESIRQQMASLQSKLNTQTIPRPSGRNYSSQSRGRSFDNQYTKVSSQQNRSKQGGQIDRHTLSVPGQDKSWSKQPMEDMKQQIKQQRRMSKNDSTSLSLAQNFDPKKKLSFRNSPVGSNQDQTSQQNHSASRQQINLDLSNHPQQPNIPSQPNIQISQVKMISESPRDKNPMSSQVQSGAQDAIKMQDLVIDSPLVPVNKIEEIQQLTWAKQEEEDESQLRSDLMHDQSHNFSENGDNDPRIILQQVQNEELKMRERELREQIESDEMSEEQQLYAEAEERVLRELAFKKQNIEKIEEEKVKEKAEKIQRELDKMSNWTSFQDSDLSEKLESEGDKMSEGNKMQLPTQGMNMKVSIQDDGRPPEGDKGAIDESFSSDNTVQDPKQPPQLTMSSAKKKRRKSPTKLQISRQVVQMDVLNEQQQLLSSKITHQTRNSMVLKRQNSDNQIIDNRHPNLDLEAQFGVINSRFIAGDLPEPAKIQSRIQDLLLRYRLDGNILNSDVISQIPQLNNENDISHVPSTRIEKSSFNNFLKRQQSLASIKDLKLEEAKGQYMQKTDRELKFKPDVSKSKKSNEQQVFLNVHSGKKRSVDQFVEDMETQRVLKLKRHKQRQDQQKQDIKQKAQSSYVSKGSRNILKKAGVPLDRSSLRRKSKLTIEVQEQSNSSDDLNVDEGMMQTSIPQSKPFENTSVNQIMSPTISTIHRPSGIQHNGMSFSQSQQDLAYYKTTTTNNLFKTMNQLQNHKKNQLSANKSEPILVEQNSSSMKSPPQTFKQSPNVFESSTEKKQRLKSSSQREDHMSSIIHNPFTHFMSNTKSSIQYLNFRKEKHDQVQKQLTGSKPRFMRLAEESPYKKKFLVDQEEKLKMQKSDMSGNKSNKKDLENRISLFLDRQNEDIQNKNEFKKNLDLEQQQKEQVDIKSPMDKPKVILDKSNRLLFKKFNKEFDQVIMGALNCEANEAQSINSYEFTQLITQLGCATTYEMMNDSSSVFKRCEELWHCLTQCALETLHIGEKDEFISVEDTKMYFMAILGIQGHRQMGLVPPQLSPQTQHALPVGFIDKNSRLCLTEQCISQIRERFSILLYNRTRFLTDKANKKITKTAKEMYQESTFKPKLVTEQMNEKILKEKKAMMTQQNEMQVLRSLNNLNNERVEFKQRSVQNDYQRFIDSKNFWIKFNQQKAEVQAVQGCTFKPDIKKSSKNISSKTTYAQNYFSVGQQNDQSNSGHFRQLSRETRFNDGDNDSVISVQEIKKRPAQNNRFEQLYNLTKHKLNKRNIISSVTREEKEFDQQANDCTFRPKLVSKQPKNNKIPSKNLMGSPKHQVKQPFQITPHKTEALDKDLIKLKVENRRLINEAVHSERQKHSHMLRKYKLDCKERSISIQKPPPVFKQSEVQKKLEEEMQLYMQQNGSPPSSAEKPFLFIDIDIGEGDKDRIAVFQNDSPTKLSKDFCSKHNFDKVTHNQLINLIKERINKVRELQNDLSQEVPEMEDEQKPATNHLSPINENPLEESPNARNTRIGQMMDQRIEQEAGERLMTNNSSYQHYGHQNLMSGSVNSNDRQLFQSIGQPPVEMPPDQLQSQNLEQIMESKSSSNGRQINQRSLGRIKNYKNMLLGEYNPMVEDDFSNQNQ